MNRIERNGKGNEWWERGIWDGWRGEWGITEVEEEWRRDIDVLEISWNERGFGEGNYERRIDNRWEENVSVVK